MSADAHTYTSPYADRLNVPMTRRWEIDELAAHICGIPDSEDDPDLDEALYVLFGIDQDQFHKVVNVLLPLVDVGQSTLNGKSFRCFGVGGIALVKEEAIPSDQSSQ